MIEEIIRFLSSDTVPIIWIFLFSFLLPLLENIFPPSPSDTLLIFIGTFAGIGRVDFIDLLIFSTIGSTLGFALMFILGRTLGNRLIISGKLSFINEENLKKPRHWFNKYGYWLIIGNRFLSGTRAIISFFAGISKLSFLITIILAFISSLIWNFILLFIGMKLGNNWHIADHFISIYGEIILPVIILIIIFFLIKLYLKRKKLKSQIKIK